MTTRDDAFRQHLSRALGWGEAHVTFEDAVAGIPVRLRGKRPRAFDHSPWELVEHIRLAQRDLLEFCTNSKYVAGEWPDDYWPKSPAPPSASSWKSSVDAVAKDRKALQDFVARVPDLTAAIPHAGGKTYLRSILLVLDHNAYHVGQLVMARKLLGSWPS
jgi:DinB superfamily